MKFVSTPRNMSGLAMIP